MINTTRRNRIFNAEVIEVEEKRLSRENFETDDAWENWRQSGYDPSNDLFFGAGHYYAELREVYYDESGECSCIDFVITRGKRAGLEAGLSLDLWSAEGVAHAKPLLASLGIHSPDDLRAKCNKPFSPPVECILTFELEGKARIGHIKTFIVLGSVQ